MGNKISSGETAESRDALNKKNDKFLVQATEQHIEIENITMTDMLTVCLRVTRLPTKLMYSNFSMVISGITVVFAPDIYTFAEGETLYVRTTEFYNSGRLTNMADVGFHVEAVVSKLNMQMAEIDPLRTFNKITSAPFSELDDKTCVVYGDEIALSILKHHDKIDNTIDFYCRVQNLPQDLLDTEFTINDYNGFKIMFGTQYISFEDDTIQIPSSETSKYEKIMTPPSDAQIKHICSLFKSGSCMYEAFVYCDDTNSYSVPLVIKEKKYKNSLVIKN